MFRCSLLFLVWKVHQNVQSGPFTTVKILNIGTCMSEQTVWILIGLRSDRDLHCLPVFLPLLEALLHRKIKLFRVGDGCGSWSGCPNIWSFYSTTYLKDRSLGMK